MKGNVLGNQKDIIIDKEKAERERMDCQNYILFKYSMKKHFIKFYKTISLLKEYIVYL